MNMPDNIQPVLTDQRIVDIARELRWQTKYDEIRDNAVELARAVEREVLTVLADREGRKQVGTLECHASGTATFWPDDVAVLALPVGEHAVYLAVDAQRVKGKDNG